MLISLTRKYYVSKLVYHHIFIISAPELSFFKNGPRRYETTPLINFLYLWDLLVNNYSTRACWIWDERKPTRRVAPSWL